MPKLFYMQFNTGEWLKEPGLRKCRIATKGVWIDLLSHMWEDGQSGSYVGTPEIIGRACGCSEQEALDAILDLRKWGVADIFPDQGDIYLTTEITVVNRRMKKLLENKNSKKNPRLNININISDPDLRSDLDLEEEFKAFYKRYPRKEGKAEGKKRFMDIVDSKEALARLNRSLSGYLRKLQVEKIDPYYFMHFSTFMNKWEDYEEYEPPSLSGSVAPNRPPLFDPKNRFAD